MSPPPLPRLSKATLASVHKVPAHDQTGRARQLPIVAELPLTIRVDGQELITLMTLGSHPELLVLGYLRNQTLFDSPQKILSIEVNWERELAEVKTRSGKGIPRLAELKRTQTTGCGQGTILSCTLDRLYEHRRPVRPLKQSQIYRALSAASPLNRIYRRAGSVHSCGLCAGDKFLTFIEDVGRHNAMDTIAGQMWMENWQGEDKLFYTTGRLTSEIVMKAALMDIPVIISRNGATQMGYELAVDLGITLIARAKSKQFVALNGGQIEFDENCAD